ncbi:ComF family protein [Altericroceibacterium endophyticum]|uniref:ComF family protein n=1 Tax=Altericroceibacterium endophyticum TaxID=1808508 RepID=A0A6I4T0H9_9SPHN|nr:ComF family protein [Altericroceibacterium endophyticum]MXO64438.1 ComF family protein [Altericroceibacterium endophyticum]
MKVGHVLRPLVDLIFPPRCPVCGDSISAQDGVCAQCWAGLDFPTEPWCQSCQRPFSANSGIEGGSCAVCLAEKPYHDGIIAAVRYNDVARSLVLRLKYSRRLGLAKLMGTAMAARLDPLEDETLLLPVPLHPLRLWHRGFNQSILLAEEIRRKKGGVVAVAALRRRRYTPSLGGKGRKSREKILRGAIDLRDSWKERIKGRDVIIVDDVLTSGATTRACVSALRKAGAKTVRIACFARVLD